MRYFQINDANVMWFIEQALAAKSIHLTKRERKILLLILKGYSQKNTAKALNLSVRTIQTHTDNLRCKVFCITGKKINTVDFLGFFINVMKHYRDFSYMQTYKGSVLIISSHI